MRFSSVSKGVAPLINNLSFGALLADKGFDNNWLLTELDERRATAVIPPRTSRKNQRAYDREFYTYRHLIENFFARMKEYRGIATRYDKTDSSYASNWNLVATPPGTLHPHPQPCGSYASNWNLVATLLASRSALYVHRPWGQQLLMETLENLELWRQHTTTLLLYQGFSKA